MNAEVRRKVEMGFSAKEFSAKHPHTDAGYLLAEGKLTELLARFQVAANAQVEGQKNVRVATTRKGELRRSLRSGAIAHVSEVGGAAASEEPDLKQTLRFKPETSTLLAFQTTALNLLSAAESHREILKRHGLSEAVLDDFGKMLEEFAAAMTLGNEARAMHIGATSELEVIAAEISRTVRVMDGHNRQRFQDNPQLLASWLGVSRVARAPRNAPAREETPPDGEVKAA